MQIGELSRRSKVPVRMLRHYEHKGLLAPSRSSNGYRAYEEADVDRAVLVSSLVRSGLPTRLILPLLASNAHTTYGRLDQDLRDLLVSERDRLDSRITCMTLSRDTVARYLADNQASPAGANT